MVSSCEHLCDYNLTVTFLSSSYYKLEFYSQESSFCGHIRASAVWSQNHSLLFLPLPTVSHGLRYQYIMVFIFWLALLFLVCLLLFLLFCFFYLHKFPFKYVLIFFYTSTNLCILCKTKSDQKFCFKVQRNMKNESEHLALEIACTYFLSINFLVQLHSKVKENPTALSHI